MVDLARRQPARYGGRPDTALAIVLDCADLDRATEFWCAALGYVALPKQAGSGPYHVLLPADGNGIELLLQKVPDAKVAKNRMHFDLRVLDLDAEVSRLVALGASQATDEPLRNNGWIWHVLQDPDGNEFCVLRPPEGHRDGLTRSDPVNDSVNDSSLTGVSATLALTPSDQRHLAGSTLVCRPSASL